jgi:hypothetical protein
MTLGTDASSNDGYAAMTDRRDNDGSTDREARAQQEVHPEANDESSELLAQERAMAKQVFERLQAARLKRTKQPT